MSRALPPVLDARSIRSRIASLRRFRRKLAAAFPLSAAILADPAFAEHNDTTPHDHAAADALCAADRLHATLVELARLGTDATGPRSRSRR